MITSNRGSEVIAAEHPRVSQHCVPQTLLPVALYRVTDSDEREDTKRTDTTTSRLASACGDSKGDGRQTLRPARGMYDVGSLFTARSEPRRSPVRDEIDSMPSARRVSVIHGVGGVQLSWRQSFPPQGKFLPTAAALDSEATAISRSLLVPVESELPEAVRADWLATHQ